MSRDTHNETNVAAREPFRTRRGVAKLWRSDCQLRCYSALPVTYFHEQPCYEISASMFVLMSSLR